MLPRANMLLALLARLATTLATLYLPRVWVADGCVGPEGQLAGVEIIGVQFFGCEVSPREKEQLPQTNDLSLAHEVRLAATGRPFSRSC